jgi:hypothetical protein
MNIRKENMSTALNFDKLTTEEIAGLRRATEEARRHQRNLEQARAGAEQDFGQMLGLDGKPAHRDRFGNIVDGVEEREDVRTYVDGAGYVQELKPGEAAPVHRTHLEKLTALAADDAVLEELARKNPDAAEELRQRQREAVSREFIALTPEFYRSDANVAVMHNFIEQNGLDWSVQNLTKAFRELAADGALEQDPDLLQDLSASQATMLSARAANGQNLSELASVAADYIKLRAPQNVRRQLKVGGAREFQKFVFENPDLGAEAAYFVFKHATVDFHETPERLARMNEILAGKFITINGIYQAWQIVKAEEKDGRNNVSRSPENEQPSDVSTPTGELDDLSDEEVERLLLKTKQLRARLIRDGV